MALNSTANLNVILNRFATLFEQSVLLIAKQYVNPKTGRDTLSASAIVKNIKTSVTDDRLVISLYDYYSFIESGRKVGAKGIPTDVLISWIKANNIRPSGISINSLAFAMQRAIKRDGIKPRPVFSRAYNLALHEIEKEIGPVVGELVNDILIRTLKK